MTSPGSNPGGPHRSHSILVARTAGTHADAEHVQTADDAVDEAERIFNQKHHTTGNFTEKVALNQVAACLNSARFESVLSIVICLNMILIIAETDLTADGQAPPLWITTANITFLAVYFIECVLKIILFRWAYFQDTWHLLDFLVVVSDVCLTSLNFLEGVERISVMRVFRLIKLSRAIRVMRQIWELKILLLGFKAAAKSIFFGMGMVLVMTLVWAILGVQLIHPVNMEIWANDTECERCQRAFASVWNAVITIFQTVIAGDSWGLLAIPLIESAWWTSLWFLVVLVTVQLAMLNLILAVIVERASDAKEKEEKKMVLEKEETMHKSKLRLIQICKQLDTDLNGRLSEDEFLAGFESNPEFAASLLGMGVYPEDIGLLFDVLDTQGSGEITYVSFVNTLARLRTQMNQVILFSITELRKAVSEVQKELRTGGARQKIPPASPVGENFKTLVQSTEEGIDKIFSSQMEEISKDMQLRLETMHIEISTSFHNALTIFNDMHGDGIQKSQQMNVMSKELDLLSRNVEAATDQMSTSMWRRSFWDGKDGPKSGPELWNPSGAAVPAMPTVQRSPTLIGGLCCGPAGPAANAPESILESKVPEPPMNIRQV